MFCLTLLTTLGSGFYWYLGFVSSGSNEVPAGLLTAYTHPSLLVRGLPYALALLAILVAHELGHYLTCRHYKIDATLPHVIPAPPQFLFGTFGAVIRIKSPFSNRKQLFDVGIAGPLAGFVVLIPVLIFGVMHSREFILTGSSGTALEFGEPLIFKAASALLFQGDPTHINLHPVGWAAWFGLVATSLNLLPVGQLDGGHIVYALLGPRWHRRISFLTFGLLIAVSLYSWPIPSYLLFALILVVLGFRHPKPQFDHGRLGTGRILLAILAFAILIVSFIPVPVKVIGTAGWIS